MKPRVIFAAFANICLPMGQPTSIKKTNFLFKLQKAIAVFTVAQQKRSKKEKLAQKKKQPKQQLTIKKKSTVIVYSLCILAWQVIVK